MMKKVFILMSLILSGLVMAGDAELGKAKSGMCAACHGVDGNSINPVWPSLAGQHPSYIARQLALFKSGERKGTVMPGMVAGLSAEDMDNLGSYFAAQKPKIGSADESLLVAGKALYQGGDTKMKIPACMACHGVTGKGNPLSGYPVLAGQHSAYVEQRLKAYRAGEVIANEDDTNGKVMAGVAQYLTDDQIKAVANYVQGLYSE